MNKTVIPIMFCFDTNYVIPAGVAFYSLMEHADKKYDYLFYILHSDITKEQQKKLRETVKEFKNVDLKFIDMNNKFDDIWINIKSKVHFSKEVLYKLLVASLFPEYDKIIVSDVDVVFLDDISKSYFSIKDNDDYYMAGVRQIGFLRNFNDVYKDKFNEQEIKYLNSICGGFIVFNLKKMREDNLEDTFVKFLSNNTDRIIYAEQDVINYCIKGNYKALPLNYVSCTYMWDFYKDDYQIKHDPVYTEKQIKNAMEKPIQLHYASSEKPWKYVDTIKSEEWFKYIVRTPFLVDFLKILPNQIIKREKEVIKKSNFKKLINYISNNKTFIFKKDFYKRIYHKLIKR